MNSVKSYSNTLTAGSIANNCKISIKASSNINGKLVVNLDTVENILVYAFIYPDKINEEFK